MKPTPRVPAPLVALLFAAVLAGCAGPVLRGKVVEGPVSFIALVDKDDPRLSGAGVAGAALHASGQMTSVESRVLARATSDERGAFVLPLSDPPRETSRIGVAARKDGYEPAEASIPAAETRRRLLVMLRPEHGP